MSNFNKRFRHDRTIEEKLNILRYYEENPLMKKKDIAAHFNMKPQTLSDLIKNSDKIRAQNSEGSFLVNCKRKRLSTQPELDKALLIWFRQNSSRPEVRIDGSMLLQQANTFLKGLSVNAVTEKTVSMSWIDRWKKRHGVSRILKAGESGSVDIEIVRDWKEGKLQEILSTYRHDDIYNADETGLFWLLFPDNFLEFIEGAHHGAKQPKSRITVLVGANMTGTDKLPLLVIGKSKNPRAFKNVTVPMEYHSNKKAWMTSIVFENWLRNLDQRMECEKRKIALIIDYCPAHPKLELKNVDLIFLPPSTISHTQPMNSGIIRNLKLHYRHSLALRRLEAAKDDKLPITWNLLDALIALKSAWKRVKVQTVVNCFKRAGFVEEAQFSVESQVEVASINSVNPTSQEIVSFQNIWHGLKEIYGDCVPNDMNDYIAVDDKVETSSNLTDTPINQAVMDPVVEGENDTDEEEETENEITVEANPIPKLSDAYAAMRTLQHYGLGCSCPAMEDIVFQLEEILNDQSLKCLRQSKITDSFTAV